VRFEVTQHQPGHDIPVRTVTDAAGVTALLARAETTGGRLHIRPHTPTPGPEGPGTHRKETRNHDRPH
jgi:hypothetical protein